MTLLDRDWIAAHVPHGGSMCLLERVLQWDARAIVCVASNHRSPDNPLRGAGRLGIAAGIEYAAQAMAVHGALLAAQRPSHGHGYLASARDVRWWVARLDDLAKPLRVGAQRLAGDNACVIYGFDLQAGGHILLEGRATVMLNAAAPGLQTR
ncbi:MAG: 3-hydroxydecanoyl-[ACP] dehydratase [Burkholderiaceae bacterium]|jgi:predicted hotdog family 3-hydroxylacyl-ACP dehydratase|nr:MAG: 3-hydroxydecanoyl-[ACP] dehydratase [Burkholderiaceae bacterium]